ncbi:MAG: ERAP1-like C-terminal domain-containing protein, partial [Acidobacteriota bacterium]|nr:ERAP1-like C-terminal domain-containing protein [Acidobacteriota bacterium]
VMCGQLSGGERKDAAGIEAGVPRELARFRNAHYRDVRYALDVVIAPGAELLTGTLELRFTTDAEKSDLVLDWRIVKRPAGQSEARVSEIVVNNRAAHDARLVNEHIVIPHTYLVKGENVVRMRFASPISASGSAVTRYRDREDGREYIYTLFVPSDASIAFPCFDQPDLKARFTLTVTAPTGWRVVTNTGVAEMLITQCDPVTDATATSTYCPPVWTKFHETEPISTYVFAFAAGEFEMFDDKESPHQTRLFVRKSKAERARKELAEVFRLNREALRFFARYFDYKFPFPKYDLVIIPEFAYGGMEHAGATFLREEAILFPTDPTANDLIARAELMFHEAAHQWFGDLVTMRWFDDLWLKEGFATFMAYKAVEELMPEYNAWKVFHQRTKPLAYLTDVTKGTTPIFQEIPNLSAAKSAYGNIVYRKAPSLLRQAEFYLGADKFQEAVRSFVKEHAYGNAEWGDLVRAFERSAGMKLGVWADAWVKRRGMPDVRVSWSDDRRGLINRFTVAQRDVLDEGGAWPMRLKILLAYDAGSEALRTEILMVRLDEAGETQVREAIGKRRPAFVFANYEDYGYGRFLLDDESRAYVLKNLGAVKDDFLRALLWGSLWESVREAELAPVKYVELAMEHAPRERDEIAVAGILARSSTAFNRYLSDAERQKIAAPLERIIFDGMMKATTPGLRITYFRAFQSIATTEEARGNLKKILAGTLQVHGMTLRERDRFDIITALMSRGDPEAQKLLAAQKTDTDDARRYAYAANAASAAAETKRRYFDAYLNDKELAESWIESSLTPFNSPLQSALTLPHLEPALRALPALKRTRKIFFINNWLGAFIGGQCSADALDTVQDFLRREASLDRDLRLKVLEATDGLERCVRIRQKYKTSGSG